MSGCGDREMAMHALLDDELDALGTVALEEHMRGCVSCRKAFDRLERLRGVLSEPELRHRAPDALRERIMATLPQQRAPAATRAPSWRAWSGGAVGGAIAASLALLVGMPQISEPGIADQLVDGHIRSLQSAHLIDVATSDRHVVKPWFNGRIDFAPQVVDLKPQGFPLVGGRLDVIDQKTVAVLVYRRRLHSINLFVRPAPAVASPFVRSLRQDSYNLVRWTSGGLEFWAVSDLGSDELQQFQQAFVRADKM
ncbi:anti-sigma factor [Novosphingobium sp. G106]|nr:anti-sigma factor [Novosphingobium sp. G106]